MIPYANVIIHSDSLQLIALRRIIIEWWEATFFRYRYS